MTPLERAARIGQDIFPPFSPMEKAALVLLRNDYPEEFVDTGELTEAGQLFWHKHGRYYVETVRAVLTAIREPGAKVVNQGGVGLCRIWTDPWDVLTAEERDMLALGDEPDEMQAACEAVAPLVQNTWTAMIDALLSDSPAT